MQKIFLVAIILLWQLSLAGQQKFVLSGHITDAATGEDLPGSTALVDGKANLGTATNSYGFYSITIASGKHSVRYQYVGYSSKIVEIDLTKNQKLDIELTEQSYELGNIVVTGERPDRNISSVEMGNVKIAPKEIEKIPIIFGEQDIVKTQGGLEPRLALNYMGFIKKLGENFVQPHFLRDKTVFTI